ncbi:MAG: BMC domain-containing protein [Clostridia bacterium]|jgi:microcompartment protein CcmL/EutN|nr:BMC domain-containing protein [Clostridia bacterium]
MKQEALGMIETRGLVASIEAADAGVKAANVRLLGYEKVRGGLVMVAFTGEVAAVQASVDAGCAAAAKVGTVISRHVIPRPEADLRMLFKGKRSGPDHDPPGSDPSGTSPEEYPDLTGEKGQDLGPDPEGSPSEALDLESMTVGELRKLARMTPGIMIKGREISRANKEQLIQEIIRAKAGSNTDNTPNQS